MKTRELEISTRCTPETKGCDCSLSIKDTEMRMPKIALLCSLAAVSSAATHGSMFNALTSIRERKALGTLGGVQALASLAQAAASNAKEREEEAMMGDAVESACALGIRTSCRAYADRRSQRRLLIDVRSTSEFELCRLPEAVNFPADELDRSRLDLLDALCAKTSAEVGSPPLLSLLPPAAASPESSAPADTPCRVSSDPRTERKIPSYACASRCNLVPQEVFIVCHHGLVSPFIAEKLLHLSSRGLFSRSEALRRGRIRFIEGGLARWSRQIDPAFPVYEEDISSRFDDQRQLGGGQQGEDYYWGLDWE